MTKAFEYSKPLLFDHCSSPSLGPLSPPQYMVYCLTGLSIYCLSRPWNLVWLPLTLITPPPLLLFLVYFFLVINRNYTYLFYHYFEWVSILVPIFWIVIVIHNERTFQSICKCFWLIFLHLFMKIWTRVSFHLWPKFWCFFKVSPHLCKALWYASFMISWSLYGSYFT